MITWCWYSDNEVRAQLSDILHDEEALQHEILFIQTTIIETTVRE